ISGQEDAPRLTLTISVGGSTDSDVTDVTVMPLMSLPRPAVITLTPPVSRRMALRKSPAETSLTTLISRTAEVMTVSLCSSVVGRLEEMTQDRAFQCRKVSRAAPARTRNVDGDVMLDPAVLDDKDAVGERHGLGDVVGHEDRGEALVAP